MSQTGNALGRRCRERLRLEHPKSLPNPGQERGKAAPG